MYCSARLLSGQELVRLRRGRGGRKPRYGVSARAITVNLEEARIYARRLRTAAGGPAT